MKIFSGVRRNKTGWSAFIKKDNEVIYVGYFKTITAARKAQIDAEKNPPKIRHHDKKADGVYNRGWMVKVYDKSSKKSIYIGLFKDKEKALAAYSVAKEKVINNEA